MNDREWTAMTDRLVAGDRLSPEEMRRVEEAARVDPARAQELALLDELEGFVDGGAEPSAESIAIAHAALARAAAQPASVPVTARAALSPRLVAVAVAVASLAAAVIAVLASPAPPGEPEVVRPAPVVVDARVTLASGEVTVGGRAVGESLPLIEASTMVAVRHGVACLAIERGIDVCLDGSTTASVEGLGEPETRVEVRRGHAVARLDPLPEGRRFALGSAELRAVAVGTVFSIDVADDGASIVTAVLEGVVEVRTTDATVRLGAHEVASLRGGVLARERLSADAEARDLALLASAPALGESIGYVAIEVSSPGATVLVDDRPLGTSPLVAALPAGDHRVELRGADGSRVGETLDVQAGAMVARRFALSGLTAPTPEPEPVEPPSDEIETTDAAPDIPARPRAVGPSPSELLAEARTFRREDRWRDAAGVYRRLLREHPRSSEAHTALVSLGDLLLDRLGEPEQAARAYLRYVREGGGALAPEARWGILRARRKQGNAKAERAAIEDFLRHHPDDARAATLR